MTHAQQALESLKTGNGRFATNTGTVGTTVTQSMRDNMMRGQEPKAIIIGCSDSRVPAELVFDQGFGDLFVIRVAGNVVAPSQIGSVEYAVQQYDIPLVVVLGHTHCGAVLATLDELERPDSARSPNLWSIVDRISPAVITLYESPLKEDKEVLVTHAVRANVRHSMDNLKRGSRMLEGKVGDNNLLIVGAVYSLETGVVEFIDEPVATSDS